MFPTPGATQSLPAIDGEYNNRIVKDSVFTGGFGISQRDIQTFLEKKGEDCEGELCLKNYRQPDTSKSAARLIRETAHEFHIDPRLLVVTLQKENSLVTAEEPEQWQYRTAMGYGCPDGEDCETDFYGFANQLQLGAHLLRAGYDRACGDDISHFQWWVHPRWTPGNVVEVDGRATRIDNCATAAIYNYTPHRVDSAWRPVDNQYFYGNYNLATYVDEWFDQF